MKKKSWIRSISVICSLIIIISQMSTLVVSAEDSQKVAVSEGAVLNGGTSLVSGNQQDYNQYLEQYRNAATPVKEITLAGGACVDNGQFDMFESDSKSGVIVGENDDSASWVIEIPEDGCYQIKLNYYPLKGKEKDIQLAVNIDGTVPFKESQTISLPRIWTDATEIKRDVNDNDLRPSQVESPHWIEKYLQDTDGYFDDPYSYYLSKGEHTIKIKANNESLAIASVTVGNKSKLQTYEQYAKNITETQPYSYKTQAEDTVEKSSSMLYPTYDRSSAATEPSHYSRIRLNTIGQTNWEYTGQSITWKTEVPEDGWYEISFKARQNFSQGLTSYRTLYVDGEVPFAEAENISFDYNLNWYMLTLGGSDTPQKIHLTKGEHKITLECSAGPMAEILKDLNDVVLDLNSIYRNIIMVTGTTPDIYRTFYLEDEVPGLMDDLNNVSNRLSKLSNQIVSLTGKQNSQVAIIDEMTAMINSFIENPLEIPERINTFQDNIESMGSVILLLGQQPLELDYFIVSANTELPDANDGFLQGLAFGAKAFIASFVEDYNSIGKSYDSGEAIKVWISNGRDQAQIIKNMIDDVFTNQTGIKVNLNIVSTATSMSSSTLVQATLAGNGPDVAMFTPMDTPINLAMRGALQDLSQFDNFESVKSRFYQSAFIPYRYQGGIYAIPETQDFDVMFYRNDILQELSITPPQTWDQFYTAISILQRKNLEVGILETNGANPGISSGITIFEKFLLQSGGAYYNSNLSATALNTNEAYDAFKKWTELYTEYGLDRSFDFFNRFRTGEMPLGIMSYSTYNQLYAAAPEIRGLWSFTLIPGTVKEDGTIDRTESSSGTGAIMLNDCRNKSAAWKFIDWWTSTDSQARYGKEVEAIMGVAARYNTANIGAFFQLGWTDSESAVIKEQWKSVTAIDQIPGNYFISRCLTNAFRNTVDQKENAVRMLNTYNDDMNSEITRKRKEFKLQ